MLNPRFFIYCRKSSEAEDRQILSIESQVREIQELAAKLNLAVAEVLMESRSAKEPGRPIFNQMMQRLYRGEAAGILCWKLDRLARNPIDGGSIIWAIKQHGIKVITPAQTYAQADDNIILMYIEFGMAQKYIDDLSKNVKRGLRAKVEKGCYYGLAPTGYLNDLNKTTGEKSLVKDPERFPLIRRIWDLMLTGLYTPPQILEMANNEWHFRSRQTRKQGGLPMSRSSIYDLLSNRFYYGRFEYPRGSGGWHQGNHEPMVTQVEFESVQVLLHRTGSPRAQAQHDFPFTGLIRCGECAGMVTAEKKFQVVCDVCRLKFSYRQRDRCPRCGTALAKMLKAAFREYTYYHCTKRKRTPCSQRAITSDDLEKQIVAFLSRIHLSKTFVGWAFTNLHELHADALANQHVVSETQQKVHQACLARIANLVNLKTSPENATGALLSDEEYAERRGELLQEKDRLERVLANVKPHLERSLNRSKETFDFAGTARKRFLSGDSKTKREILLQIGSNLTFAARNLSIGAKKPFQIIEESIHPLRAPAERFEPETTEEASGSIRPIWGLRPLVWTQADDVRTWHRRIQKMAASIYRFYCQSDDSIS